MGAESPQKDSHARQRCLAALSKTHWPRMQDYVCISPTIHMETHDTTIHNYIVIFHACAGPDPGGPGRASAQG